MSRYQMIEHIANNHHIPTQAEKKLVDRSKIDSASFVSNSQNAWKGGMGEDGGKAATRRDEQVQTSPLLSNVGGYQDDWKHNNHRNGLQVSEVYNPSIPNGSVRRNGEGADRSYENPARKEVKL